MDLTRNCIECGKGFVGRADKKFCSDICRNACNNRQRSATSNHIRAINNILNKNRKILEQYFPNGADVAKTSKGKLMERGFNFNYITSVGNGKKGMACYYCYEFGYQVAENDNVVIMRKKD